VGCMMRFLAAFLVLLSVVASPHVVSSTPPPSSGYCLKERIHIAWVEVLLEVFTIECLDKNVPAVCDTVGKLEAELREAQDDLRSCYERFDGRNIARGADSGPSFAEGTVIG